MTTKPGITAALALLTSALWAIPDTPAQDQDLIASYLPVAAIARNGFVRDKGAVAEAQGREIHLWGFVDSGNLYGDEDTRRVLGDWWSGEGPSAGI